MGCLSRRHFLASVAGAGAFLCGGRAAAQVAAAPRRIDVHHHFTPDVYLRFLKEHMRAPGAAAAVPWVLQQDLADMDASGTQTAILTITTPGFVFAERDTIRRVVRECNDAAAKICTDHPGRFGSFAAIMPTDPEGALPEIAYALDTLKADGICLFTNYGDRWLGHASFVPVYEELNRRRAVVYVHPITANCCGALQLSVPNEGAMIEFGTDTTRTIADLIFSGMTTKFPDIVWIFSHAGGTMPFLIERFLQGAAAEIVPGITTKGMAYAPPANVPKGVLFELRKMMYDTAQVSNPVALGALRKVVPVSQIVYGTDYWYRTSVETAQGLTTSGVFDAAELRSINRGNAERILPRYRK
jgi:predicted TIM-barrel fold metal-dependent hydrolase